MKVKGSSFTEIAHIHSCNKAGWTRSADTLTLNVSLTKLSTVHTLARENQGLLKTLKDGFISNCKDCIRN